MLSLAQALRVTFQRRGSDGFSHYLCELDRNWAIGSIPQGGYSLGVVVEACIQEQAGSNHADPIHVTAHYIRATNAGVGEVRVKVLKSGKTFTNIIAELVQKDNVKITAHLLFGDLSPSQSGRVLAPPSPYARRVPLYSHPSMVAHDAYKPPWARKMEVQMAVDDVLLSHNDPNSPLRTTSESVGGGGVEWAAWLQLTHQDDQIVTSAIPFFCDSFVNLPSLIPQSEPGSSAGLRTWFPTITMTVEFKARIPSFDKHSNRTIGLFSESRFQTEPEGRHNSRVEVWTAPSDIGRGTITKGWRDDQYCIAVADQMALMLPAELNRRQGTRDSAKL